MDSIQSAIDSSQESFLIILDKGFSTFVDIVDRDLVLLRPKAHKASKSSNLVYAISYLQKPPLLLHRVIMERIIGRPLETKELVDHIDGNSLNNHRANLRVVTHAQNMKNRKTSVTCKSGYKGVYFDPSGNKWRVQIYCDGKKIPLGRFDTAEQGYEAYCKAALKYHGQYARIK